MYSCRNEKDNGLSDDSLNEAGANRPEIEKVFRFYSNPEDSLKRKAALFLLTNMRDHYGYTGAEIKKYANVFSLIDSSSYTNFQLSNQDKMTIGDSMVKRLGWPHPGKVEKVKDLEIISASYLTGNIEYAFKAWKKAPWANYVSFNDFCEYILPYRIRDEQLQYWRPKFYEEYTNIAYGAPNTHDLKSVFDHMSWQLNTETGFTTYFNKYYPFTQSISDILKGRIGGCETTSFISATAMRAAGIPVALDYIPNWGNTNSRHFMVKLIDHRKPNQLITNKNSEENTWGIVDFSTEFMDSRHKFTEAEFPEGMYIQHVKTIPKVYRFTYSESAEMQALHRAVPAQFIAPEFHSKNIKDVTEEYLKHASITLKLKPGSTRHKAVHLCIFNRNGWFPVAVSANENNVFHFKKIGRNVVYVPTTYLNGKHKVISNPFYIDSVNRIHHLKKSLTKQDVKLWRKAPLHSYTAYHTEILKGGTFQASNFPDFKDAVLLYQIEGYPFYMNTVRLKNTRPFRYLRYQAVAGGGWEADNIAEVQFYEKKNADTVLLEGELIGRKGTVGHEIEKAFDNNMDSYYENAENKDGWIGLDLGEGNESVVNEIRFCPRNDTNCIMPGNEYELFYWDKSWISLGSQTAKDYDLIYHEVPAGALFWLKCLSGGSEERIFTYQNGKQIWW
ncbi:hypothetical protein [Pedobacter hiemivivus]|nr:hypothetical protein [Pedobacter hiemivivus]TCC96010.1 hypothetical protein EZ444_13240 [Pedobacter hiemivivus]